MSCSKFGIDIQEASDGDWDYTLYIGDMAIDGGRIDGSLSLAEALEEIKEMHRVVNACI